MTVKLYYPIFLMILSITSCTFKGCNKRKDPTPAEQLYNYISIAVNVRKAEEKQSLIDLSTGALKAQLVSMTNESFHRAYIDKKYEFKGFFIQESKNLGKKDAFIDFKLEYKSYNSGENPVYVPFVTTTNRAFFIYEYGKWVISRVENKETNFDWKEGIPVDASISTEEYKNLPESEWKPKEIISSREEKENQEIEE